MNDNVYYADDGTRFSSIIDRDCYNNKLKEKNKMNKKKRSNFTSFFIFYKFYTKQSLTFY